MSRRRESHLVRGDGDLEEKPFSVNKYKTHRVVNTEHSDEANNTDYPFKRRRTMTDDLLYSSRLKKRRK